MFVEDYEQQFSSNAASLLLSTKLFNVQLRNKHALVRKGTGYPSK